MSLGTCDSGRPVFYQRWSLVRDDEGIMMIDQQVAEPPTESSAAPRPHRVLIEQPDGAYRQTLTTLFEQRGFEVMVCGGPRELQACECPLVAAGRCAAVEEVDVALFDLDLDDPADAQVLRALRTTYPALEIVIEVPSAKAQRHAGLLAGVTALPPVDPAHLVDVVVDTVRV